MILDSLLACLGSLDAANHQQTAGSPFRMPQPGKAIHLGAQTPTAELGATVKLICASIALHVELVCCRM